MAYRFSPFNPAPCEPQWQRSCYSRRPGSSGYPGSGRFSMRAGTTHPRPEPNWCYIWHRERLMCCPDGSSRHRDHQPISIVMRGRYPQAGLACVAHAFSGLETLTAPSRDAFRRIASPIHTPGGRSGHGPAGTRNGRWHRAGIRCTWNPYASRRCCGKPAAPTNVIVCHATLHGDKAVCRGFIATPRWH
jgi:hypothetical protein